MYPLTNKKKRDIMDVMRLLSALKKASFLSILFLLVQMVVPTSVLAQTPIPTIINACPQDGSAFANLCNLGVTNLGRVIAASVNFIFVLAVLLALGYLIWGAIKWITSEGNKEKVEEARNQIIAAIVGLVVIAMSYLVLNIVLGFFLPGSSLQNLQLPHL